MEFGEIASVSGKGGLFKVLKPTRTGVILESLDEEKKKMVVGMQAKVSVLSDISIYTTDGEGSVPLQDVMQKIHGEFNGDTGLSGTSEPDELKSFLKFIIPNYDESRVYVSDIKKLINWYNQLTKIDPAVFSKKEESKDDKADGKEDEGSAEKAAEQEKE
ncbi:MAG: DUF5606 domain-containing protein [Cyclobacteriaceae bacterium]|nr:DUF5606 domain-containing protein [Cyclobacteriaceae bacterium HetDA_MAG_MS6]